MSIRMVDQLKFTRSEFVRCFKDVSIEDGGERLMPSNSIGWMIAHLANQENGYWNYLAQGIMIHRELRKLAGYGKPATTPPINEMWDLWEAVTETANQYLDDITEDDLSIHLEQRGNISSESVGTLLMRNTFHYWFHMGEGSAIRQQLGHENLPEFIGNMNKIAY